MWWRVVADWSIVVNWDGIDICEVIEIYIRWGISHQWEGNRECSKLLQFLAKLQKHSLQTLKHIKATKSSTLLKEINLTNDQWNLTLNKPNQDIHVLQ